MGLQLIEAPAQEPVTLAQAKNRLRIDDGLTADDALINMLIKAARIYAETETGRSFITQRWRLTRDGFYQRDADCTQVIALERGTVQSIDTIGYLDTAGQQQTMDLSQVAKDLSSLPARISPLFGAVWPITLPQIAAVTIDYTAGYGDDPDDVPEGIRQWLLLRLTTLYEHPDEVEIVTRGRIEPLPFVDGLLDPYKVLTV